MNVINYDKEMLKIISENKKLGVKPTLLLHACCAPCATSVIERIKDDFNITLFFYNPNMDSLSEYELRLSELNALANYHGINVIDLGYNHQEFLQKVVGKESEKEGGFRCFICYEQRLDKTAQIAKEKGFDYFTTTLTVSPLKNAGVLNEKGKSMQEKYGVNYLPSDFKKNNGYMRSVELSKEFNMYRQNYCGCEFSKNKNV